MDHAENLIIKTLQAPLSGVIQGQGFVITGTVIDISAGTKQTAIAVRFPNGVPAVDELSQTPWMEYVYMQNPKPASTTGVPVSITLVDPNGNTNVVGTAVSESDGRFSFQVTPDMVSAGAGSYKVVASFDGSNSYWPSQASSAFVLNSASAAGVPTPTSGGQSPADLYFVPAIAGLFVLIIVVAIVLALLMLRKRP